MNSLFLNKYQPRHFNDFETDSEMIEILNTLISIDIGAPENIKLSGSTEVTLRLPLIQDMKFKMSIVFIN